MKFFVIACLIAVAVAEPAAEAKGESYWGGAYGGALGYGGAVRPSLYGSGISAVRPAYSGYSGYSPYSWGNQFGVKLLGKRDADAEPSYHSLMYGAVRPSMYGGYSSGISAIRPVLSGYSSYSPYSSWGQGFNTYGKHSADAEPTAEAESYHSLMYGGNNHGVVMPYGSYGSGISAVRPVFSGYSGYSPYSWGNQLGYKTSFGKRSADAEPTAEGDSYHSLMYGGNAAYMHGLGVGYSNYRRPYSGISSYSPYSTYTGLNAGYSFGK